MTEPKATPKKAGVLLNVPGVIDTKREAEGDWFDHEKVEGFKELLLDKKGNGLRAVHVRSRFTAEYRNAEQLMHTKAFRKKEEQRIPFITEKTGDLNAAHCVVDWDFTDRDGNEIPFTREAVDAIYTSEGHEGILQFRHHRMFIEASIAALQVSVDGQREADAGE